MRKSLRIYILLPVVMGLLIYAECSKNESGTDGVSRTKKTTAGAIATPVTMVELGSLNCIPCRMMQPVMKQIEEEYAGKIHVVFYDVMTAEGKPRALQYGIEAIPTQVFLDANRKEFFRHTGYFPKDSIVLMLKRNGVL